MINFGLVTEGKTDQIVIENILTGYFQSDDLDVRELQPLRDETDEQRGQHFGGWYKVFEYCQSDKFKQAFQFNDYVIVQIDTDESEKKHYDVSKRGKRVYYFFGNPLCHCSDRYGRIRKKALRCIQTREGRKTAIPGTID